MHDIYKHKINVVINSIKASLQYKAGTGEILNINSVFLAAIHTMTDTHLRFHWPIVAFSVAIVLEAPDLH